MAFAPSQYSQGYGDVNPDAIEAWTGLFATATATGVGIASKVKASRAAKREKARRRKAAKKRRQQSRIQAAVDAAAPPAPMDYYSPPAEKTGPPIGLILGLVAVLGVGGFLLLKGKKKKKPAGAR
jgi:hypothetical protein